MKNGLLLINLGTPDSPALIDVARYLREFLSDKRVIDLPWPLRYLLIFCLILPTRTNKAARAYQSIWDTQGAPLRYHSQNLCKKVQARLGKDYLVVLSMRYGNPSLKEALLQLQNCEHLTVLPLYPQYASATTGSSIEHVLKALQSQSIFPSLKIIRDFYQHPGFIQAQAELIRPFINNHEYILFSYHGLPERHVQRLGCQSVCSTLCPTPSNLDKNQICYRAQCFHTTKLIASALQLDSSQFSTSFQSRLGRTPWLQPYTDLELKVLADRGIKRLIIVCPSFVSDCLETLEEIGIRAKQKWKQLGGEQLTLVPCLNDSKSWVDAIIDLIK